MRFRKFTIQNYRAITGPLVIDLHKQSLTPIIGVNECGKTTILHAIFAFDFFNDSLNDNGRHLKDTTNLYRTSSPPPRITAEIELSEEEFVERLDDIKEPPENVRKARLYKRRRRQLPNPLRITRNLRTKKYSIESAVFTDIEFNDLAAQQILRGLPWILYFDDFRDSIDERIKIVKQADGSTAGWLSILEQLFKQTDPAFSVFSLKGMEERRRKSVLAKVNRKLNETLTREWQNFRLDDTDALQISLEFETGGGDFLKLDIVERDVNGDEHYFFVRDRSKGFFWFFNFVMKLEFNPKVVDEGDNTVYLLDEPGSFLHASAQSKLCSKLKQLSNRNKVLYCTHSHYLLDPEVIPLSTIKVADKDGNGNIQLISIHEHSGNILERRSAFQPIIDALHIKPFLLDLTQDRVILTEGIYDYYALEMLKQGRNVNILPSVGADSVRYYISLMIAWHVSYCVLWDNDDSGRRSRARAEEMFGEEMARRHFFLLPLERSKNRILQNLFTGNDIRMIKNELDIPNNSSFQKVIATLFYHARKVEIVGRLSKETKKNFETVFEGLKLS
ncbi:MAG TPA: AAA family ATPase [Pyrinomonadaceae bacterium]|nr:AAA family ATPase [Pyrinomonadaceae bacterium]